MSARVAVIGAGITGLVAAWELRRAGLEPIVLEASDRAGGSIRTSRKDGFLFECGPNSFPNSAADLAALIDDLGLRSAVVPASEAASQRLIYHRGELTPVPTGPKSLITSRLFSVRQKLRVLSEPFIPARTEGTPETVAQFFHRRFGLQATRTLVDAFVSGIYAGDARLMSISAAFPLMCELEKEYGSVLKGLRARRANGVGADPTICSFTNGMEQLTEKLTSHLGEAVRLSAPVCAISGNPGDGLRVVVGDDDDREEINVDRVLVTVPAEAAGRLLMDVNPMVADLMFDVTYSPIFTVHASFLEESLPPLPRAFGYLVPRPERMRTLGWIFSSTAFPDRAPEGHVAMTGFVGGSHDGKVLQESDEAIRYFMMGELSLTLGMKSFPKPDRFDILRHPIGIPQPEVGHERRVAAISQLMGMMSPGISVVGNWTGGVSVNNCVQTGRAAATDIVKELAGDGAP